MAGPKETQKALMHKLGLELVAECAMRPATPNLVGVDAAMPYHRIANPTPAEHLARLVRERQYEEQKPFRPYWLEILGGIQESRYHTKKEIALAYGKPTRWVTALVAVAVRQGVLSEAEVESCFKWGNCFKPVNWRRRLSEKYPQTRAEELLRR